MRRRRSESFPGGGERCDLANQETQWGSEGPGTRVTHSLGLFPSFRFDGEPQFCLAGNQKMMNKDDSNNTSVLHVTTEYYQGDTLAVKQVR